MLKIYGINPNKFKRMSIKNSGVRSEDRPFRLKDVVRLSWSHIKLDGISIVCVKRE